jgi:hypothetical protein
MPLQYWLLTPELQWRSRGQMVYLTEVSAGNARGRHGAAEGSCPARQAAAARAALPERVRGQPHRAQTSAYPRVHVQTKPNQTKPNQTKPCIPLVILRYHALYGILKRFWAVISVHRSALSHKSFRTTVGSVENALSWRDHLDGMVQVRNSRSPSAHAALPGDCGTPSTPAGHP